MLKITFINTESQTIIAEIGFSVESDWEGQHPTDFILESATADDDAVTPAQSAEIETWMGVSENYRKLIIAARKAARL
jgi:hypothetical protein